MHATFSSTITVSAFVDDFPELVLNVHIIFDLFILQAICT